MPTGSLPAHLNVTPFFQSDPPTWLIACVDAPVVTRTQSAGDPSRVRNETVTTIVVAVVPLRGATAASDNRVGPEPAQAGATAANSSATETTAAATTARWRAVGLESVWGLG